jgi:hypothetical protein
MLSLVERSRRPHFLFHSGRLGQTRDLPPALKSLTHLLTINGRGESMSARTKVLGDRTIGGGESLRLTWGFESLHPPLALAGGLMRVLRPIIEIPVLAMFYSWKNLPLGSSVALEFICDDYTRDVG